MRILKTKLIEINNFKLSFFCILASPRIPVAVGILCSVHDI
jgi:hypothetical protein